ncbi:MAG TPA: protein kinase [Kofleriaceae bacterium]|nr:protein kinase [Kofleriaceae bacterium]
MTTCPTCARPFESSHRFCPHDGALLPAFADHDPLLGTVLDGQFELREVIGEGASGMVYRGWQASMERWVAVKVLHPELANDDFMVERMRREARAVARLSHPGIVGMFTTGVTLGGAPYLVMELVEGVTLEQAIDSGVPLSTERVAEIGLQIAAALADSHAAGVVHRDLKPANIMVVKGRRGAERIKVLDFGIAKLVTSGIGGALVSGDGQLTATGAICGTPHYLAPEQASGEDIDHRVDLYSLGVLLYRLASGRLPFDGNPVAVLLGHIQDPPPAPRGVSDPRLVSLIMRCLQKDPARRPQSAEEIADELAGLAEGRAARQDRMGRAPTVPITGELRAMAAAAAPESWVELPRARRRMPLVLALVVAIGVGAGGHALIERNPGPSSRTAVAAVAPPAAVTRLEQSPPVVLQTPDAISAPEGPPAREVVVAEGGYSMRLLLPARMVVGMRYAVILDVWDPNGDPIATPEMILTLDDPDGHSRGVAARPAREAGRYRFDQVFEAAGVHELRVYPPAGGTAIRVHVDVIEPGAAL